MNYGYYTTLGLMISENIANITEFLEMIMGLSDPGI